MKTIVFAAVAAAGLSATPLAAHAQTLGCTAQFVDIRGGEVRAGVEILNEHLRRGIIEYSVTGGFNRANHSIKIYLLVEPTDAPWTAARSANVRLAGVGVVAPLSERSALQTPNRLEWAASGWRNDLQRYTVPVAAWTGSYDLALNPGIQELLPAAVLSEDGPSRAFRFVLHDAISPETVRDGQPTWAADGGLHVWLKDANGGVIASLSLIIDDFWPSVVTRAMDTLRGDYRAGRCSAQ